MKECTHVHDSPHRADSHSNTDELYSYSSNASYNLLDTRSFLHTKRLCPHINMPVQLICFDGSSTASVLLCSIQILKQPLAAPWLIGAAVVETVSSPASVLPAYGSVGDNI